MSSSDLTIFEKILTGDIPCSKVYEDEDTFAFDDVYPQAPVHVLVILKKKKFVNVSDAELNSDEDALLFGKLLQTAKKVAQLKGIEKAGYRLVINNGADAHQTVWYLHCHVIGGRSLGWPPG